MIPWAVLRMASPWAVLLFFAACIPRTLASARGAIAVETLHRHLRSVQTLQASLRAHERGGPGGRHAALLDAGHRLEQAVLFRLVSSAAADTAADTAGTLEKRALAASLRLFNGERRYAEAAAVLAAAIAEQEALGLPGTGWLHSNLGEIYKVGFGRLEEAAAQYSAAVASAARSGAPASAMRRARTNLGWLLANELGRATEAAAVFRGATAVDPADGGAWFGLAQHAASLGETIACYWREAKFSEQGCAFQEKPIHRQ
jgi:tetratricopeptide (TPR) repeat protein